MTRVICTECRQVIRGKLMDHYRARHPFIHLWAKQLNVTARQTRRLFRK